MSTDQHDDEEAEEDRSIFYKMDANPRGLCYIINNRKFYQDRSDPAAKKLDCRDGSDKDREALRQTFERLNFNVQVHDDLTDTEMMDIMKQIAHVDHSDYDCLAVCILTHGALGKLYGSNGKAVDVRDLTFHVKPQNCASLGGKPKLFFLQACQGEERQIGYPTVERDTAPMVDCVLVPSEGDFLLSYSTVPGFESYRDPERGSAYVYHLTRYLDRYSDREHMLDILTRVNDAVSRDHHSLDDGHSYKQVPAPLSTLRKKVFFGQDTPTSPLVDMEALNLQAVQDHADSDVSLSASRDYQSSPDAARAGSTRSAQTAQGQGSPDDIRTHRKYSILDTSAVKLNVPCEVKITTGDVPEAEITDAVVTLILFGVNGTTPPIVIDKGKIGTQRGHTDELQLQIKDVAPLKKLRVSIDTSSGKKTVWKLDKIEIWNMATFTQSLFHCGQWLGTGKTSSVDIPAIERGETLLREVTYRVTVKTSSKHGAGTDSNVYVILFGVNGDSGPLPLKTAVVKRNLFENGQVDEFVFTILSLGELYKVRVWHDNTGVGAAWHLSSIDVKDENTNKVYSFPCDRWLSLKDEDKQIIRELPCTTVSGPPGNVVYEIEVKTADQKDSGTAHNGWLVLEGDVATSQVIKLNNHPQHKILRRGQTNFFTLTSPSLGILQTCTLGVSARADQPKRHSGEGQVRWRCQEVIVTDTTSGKRILFPCGLWVKDSTSPTHGLLCKAARSEETYFLKAKKSKPVLYNVSVCTGNEPRGGTDANVSICIYGELGDTGPRPLRKTGKNLFECGKVDEFKLEALDLGQLTMVHIEHDNSGVQPAWFLDHIQISKPGSQSSVFFRCRQWLRIEEKLARDLEPT